MKVNRDMTARAGLKLLNEVGLEQLTLRLLGRELKVQAATIYWHFKSKEELIDEMATTVLAEGARQLVPAKESSGWGVWAASFGIGLRNALLAYRDGARMVAGTRLTNTEYMKTAERVGAKLVESGFTVRQAVVLLSTIYNYTLSFVMEEQAVFPRPNQRSPQYDIARRNAKLDPEEFPLLRKSGPILFDKFDRRYKEGLDLILGWREVARRPSRSEAMTQSSFPASRRACASLAPMSTSAQPSLQQIRLAMAGTNDLFNIEVFGKRNFDALDQIYTNGARILPPGAPMISGRKEIREFWSKLISSVNAKSAVLSPVDVIPAGEDVIEIGRATLTVEPTGQSPSEMEVKYVVHWKQEDGRWKWNIDIWNANS